MKALPILTACVLLAATGAAKAATVTETYDFTASGFPSGSPINPWTGSFTITFDPTKASSGALDAFSSNLPASYGTFTFFYPGPGGVFGFTQLLIGDMCDLPAPFGCGASPFSDTAFMTTIVSASGGLSFGNAGVAAASTNSFSTFTGTLTPVPSTTPLPATLPLFASGLGALGLLGWRRKRKARVN